MSRFRGRKKLHTRWIPYLYSGVIQPGVNGWAGLTNPGRFQIINPTEVEGYLDRVLVHRVVGECMIQNASTTEDVHVRWGVRTGNTVDTAVGIQGPMGMWAQDDNMDAWMLLRTQFIPHTPAGFPTQSNRECAPFGAFFDIRSKRVLRHQDSLELFMSVGENVALAPYATLTCRALISV